MMKERALLPLVSGRCSLRLSGSGRTWRKGGGGGRTLLLRADGPDWEDMLLRPVGGRLSNTTRQESIRIVRGGEGRAASYQHKDGPFSSEGSRTSNVEPRTSNLCGISNTTITKSLGPLPTSQQQHQQHQQHRSALPHAILHTCPPPLARAGQADPPKRGKTQATLVPARREPLKSRDPNSAPK